MRLYTPQTRSPKPSMTGMLMVESRCILGVMGGALILTLEPNRQRINKKSFLLSVFDRTILKRITFLFLSFQTWGSVRISHLFDLPDQPSDDYSEETM